VCSVLLRTYRYSVQIVINSKAVLRTSSGKRRRGEKNLKLKVSKREWDYTCGDGCCYEYGVEIGFTKEDGTYVFGLRNYEASLSFDDVLILLRSLRC
jgi:hypothetical protein